MSHNVLPFKHRLTSGQVHLLMDKPRYIFM